MNKSVFVVSSEMQLINSIEAAKHFQAGYKLLIIANIVERNHSIVKLIEDYKLHVFFDHIINLWVIQIDKRFYRTINFFISLFRIRIMSFKTRFDYVFSGYYDDIIHRYASYFFYRKGSKVVIIDDGVANFDIVRKRIIELQEGKVQIKNQGSGVIRYYINYWKKRNHIISHLIFFSCLDLVINKEIDSLIVNNYSFTRSSLKYIANDCNDRNDKGRLFILGGPYVEDGDISKDSYRNVLKLLLTHYPGETMVYIPHPKETSIYDFTHPNFIVRKLNCPFELFVLTSSCDITIIGFYSSVLLNMKTIRPDIEGVYFVDISTLLSLGKDYQDKLGIIYEKQRQCLKEIKL